MTSTLYDALKRMSVVREGLVVRNLDGGQGDGQSDWVIARICRRAGLPVHYWHVRLRYSRRAVWCEPVAAADVDVPQADRRDHALRARR